MSHIKDILIECKLCSEDSIFPFYPSVRDNDTVSVYRCKKSGIIFLDNYEVTDYHEKSDYSYWSCESREEGLKKCRLDDEIRFLQFRDMICNKRWLDIGAGLGGVLDLLSSEAQETHAVEPQKFSRKELNKLHYNTYHTIDDAPDNYFDVITLFHVFEHFSEPLLSLKIINDKLGPEGIIIIEVPHAKDFLIDFLDMEEFKKFTLWSEHLILHTRTSLKVFLEKTNFNEIVIQGFQRYPLANTLYWLKTGKPGGHKTWQFLCDRELDRTWSNKLKELDLTDTLIAIAKKG